MYVIVNSHYRTCADKPGYTDVPTEEECGEAATFLKLSSTNPQPLPVDGDNPHLPAKCQFGVYEGLLSWNYDAADVPNDQDSDSAVRDEDLRQFCGQYNRQCLCKKISGLPETTVHPDNYKCPKGTYGPIDGGFCYCHLYDYSNAVWKPVDSSFCYSQSPTPRLTTHKPTRQPTPKPTSKPTKNPSPSPTECPTSRPTKNPSPSPTEQPTRSPSDMPTPAPSVMPTTTKPSMDPSVSPTSPTLVPSVHGPMYVIVFDDYNTCADKPGYADVPTEEECGEAATFLKLSMTSPQPLDGSSKWLPAKCMFGIYEGLLTWGYDAADVPSEFDTQFCGQYNRKCLCKKIFGPPETTVNPDYKCPEGTYGPVDGGFCTCEEYDNTNAAWRPVDSSFCDNLYKCPKGTYGPQDGGYCTCSEDENSKFAFKPVDSSFCDKEQLSAYLFSIVADSHNIVTVFAFIGALSVVYFGVKQVYKVLLPQHDFKLIEDAEI